MNLRRLQAGKHLCIMTIIAACLFPMSAFGSEMPIDIRVVPAPEFGALNANAVSLLHSSKEHPLGIFLKTYPDAASDLFIQYSSPLPIPVLIAPEDLSFSRKYEESEALYGVLPSGTSVNARVSLSSSPGWYPGRSGFVVLSFAPEDAPPQLEIIGENHANLFSAAVSQLSRPESFEQASINILQGYKVFGMSLSSVLGVLLILLVCLFLILRRTPDRYVFAIALSFMAIAFCYQSRFAFDLVRQTFIDLNGWHQSTSYRQHSGDLYAALANMPALSSSDSVTVCGVNQPLHAKALSYFLYPAVVKTADENWETATYGILLQAAWKEEKGSVWCEGKERKGSIVKALPQGGAIVTFTTKP